MSQIYTYNNNAQKQYTTQKPNTVLKVSRLDWLAVQIVQGDGAITMAAAIRFGKNPETGKPQIALMTMPKINETFAECPPGIYEQLVERWDALDNPDKALDQETKLESLEGGV